MTEWIVDVMLAGVLAVFAVFFAVTGSVVVAAVARWCPLESENQCDGCRQNLPVHNGIHYRGKHCFMVCCKEDYGGTP